MRMTCASCVNGMNQGICPDCCAECQQSYKARVRELEIENKELKARIWQIKKVADKLNVLISFEAGTSMEL